ncbi:hypothetical protein SLS60_008779 [Paraconiothyrium brasiliense]|uniref:Uncharacterized protein n=1 Tax=Paraconiothyrium brasiliense TaxID=300254 RepID=A0ABR3QYG0_9PLEO
MKSTANRYRNHLREQYVKGGYHPRRGLDEIGYEYHSKNDLKRRNSDQVMAKFLRQDLSKVQQSVKHKSAAESSKPLTQPEVEIVVADQLWLWILDPDHLNIDSDIRAVGETRDVIEELEMMLHVAELQRHTLYTTDYTLFKPFVDRITQELGNLRDQAKDVHEMVSIST